MEGVEGYFLFFFDNVAMQQRRGRAHIASRLIMTTLLELMELETEASPALVPSSSGGGVVTTAAVPDRDANMLRVAIQRRIDRVFALVGLLTD